MTFKSRKMDNPKKQRVSLTLKLTTSIILIVSIITFLTSIVVYGFFSTQSKKRYIKKSKDYLNYLKKNLEIPLWNMDEDSVVKICKSFSENEEVDILIVSDYKGSIIFQKDKGDSEVNIKTKTTIKLDGNIAGHITFGLTKRIYNEKNKQLLIVTFLTMALVILGLSLSTKLVLGGLLQKPIESLLKRIQEIREGNYNDNSLSSEYPEIVSILDNFNQMARQVANREERLKEAQRLAKIGNWELGIGFGHE